MNVDPYSAAAEAAAALKARCAPPTVGVVLGSGLGAFAGQLHDRQAIPYSELPYFPTVGVKGHAGELVVGRARPGGPLIAALSGRVHLYEGFSPAQVVHPVRTLQQWGVKSVVFTNAAGGIGPGFVPGDLMLITDHINLTGQNPLTGPADLRLGPRFPDMSAAYDPELCRVLRAAAREVGIPLREGVYAGLSGPSYETPAEINMLSVLGGQAVGMSTVCEVIAARHAGMRVAGISCITNLAAGLSPEPLDHTDIAITAAQVRDAFVKLLTVGLEGIVERVEQPA